MKKNYLNYLAISCIAVLALLFVYSDYSENDISHEAESQAKEFWSTKKTKVKSGNNAFMKPDGFIKYFNSIAKRVGEKSSGYVGGYRVKELTKSLALSARVRRANLSADFKSRGPGNVGGRTRAIAIDPDDATNCTWIAGAASGGLWKTTDCGDTWVNISPDLPNLSTNSIAQAASDPNVIYVGTGEVFGGNTTFVRGDGIYKSVDRGANWTLLSSTVSNTDYISVNRIAVDPNNENIVIIATNSGIYKSIDGGNTWTETYNAPAGSSVQDLQVDPNDFNIQYAGVNSKGIFKSVDAGASWLISSDGMPPEGARFEIAISPSNPNIVYTSTHAGETTIVYYSANKGANWFRVEDPEYNTNFLGGQGWYDNTIAVNPYNPYEVFVGGVSIGKYSVDTDSITKVRQFQGVDAENTAFLDLFDFNATFNRGSLDISTGSRSPSEYPVTVEVRWGGSNTQKAHRFTVPADAGTSNDGGAGIPPSEYIYQDYIDVPFEVWDVETGRQLMVSFRDQEGNGVFNLNARDETNDPSLLTAREYIYIHDIDYDPANPNTAVSTETDGVQYANMYFFWPILADGATWDPDSYTNAISRIKYDSTDVYVAEAVAVYDAYGSYKGQNQNNLHPDHHHLTMVKMDDVSETFMIVNGNDGGLGISTDNGNEIVQITNGYVTTQFYGADKKPGEEKYIGGTQDNGTWVSSGNTVDKTNPYKFVIGGDGFEVLWHPTDPSKVLGSIYNNRIQKSTNGGESFSASINGISSGDGPFITRLAGSVTSPEVVYAIGAEGVYKSTNFAGSWTMKNIGSPYWGGTASASDVEVSLANDQIVWAGAGMADANTQLKFFVSTDAGENYQPVNNYSPLPNAYSTGIYTHPTDENTAYALFSRANFPKILKTTDLGQTWTDISGFEGNNGVSDRGFPDVFVHSLLVMPFDTNIIWAGTEIGLFESLDGGLSWNIRNDIPSVSIWSMKIVDDEVVIGTHGRGIWTATITELEKFNLKIDAFSYVGYGGAEISVDLPVAYDQVKVMLNGTEFRAVNAPNVGKNTFSLDDFYEFSGAEIQIIGVINGEEFSSYRFAVEKINVAPEILNFETTISGDVYPVVVEVENNEPFEKVEVLFGEEVVYTDEQSLTLNDEKRVISFDFGKQETNSLQIKAYIQGQVFVTNGDSYIITANSQETGDGIKIFPNPTVNYLNISSQMISISEVKIYNSNGVEISTININSRSNNTQLDLRALNQGIYLVQLTGQDGRIFSKRIIKK